MLRLVTITSMLFALLGSCNEIQPEMSASNTDDANPAPNTDDANPAPENHEPKPKLPVTNQKNADTGRGTICFWSARLSGVTAERVIGTYYIHALERKRKWNESITDDDLDKARIEPPLFKSSDGRQEWTADDEEIRERSKKNNDPAKKYPPTTTGKCVLNWFGQDHSKEPWVSQLQNKYPSMHAVVTCTADYTPYCTCIKLFKPPPYGVDSLHHPHDGYLCLREAADGGHEAYSP